ncbi:N-6 DNA methylase [Rhodocytophaga aerolata]|uniref:site-specific DNA-methyltransferase (adenine-specific) n=1 Tax=Rhodocytophaga aerolata TaxID=455078 RepID=A0ABT8R686_9BACT|nr:N-6 DNA methylase [Rhodocytophaga aerolata]MDO1447454.1 N-6 DNA methylase [Rhodocytophaga aerolata]
MYNDLILSLNHHYRKFKDKDKEPSLFFHFLALLALKYIYDTRNKALPFKLETSLADSLQQIFRQNTRSSVAVALDKVIAQLSKKYKSTLAGVFLDISFRELGNGKEKNLEAKLSSLISEVADMDLSSHEVDEAHGLVVGAAIEYLIEKFAEEHFHKSGFLYTPRSISRLMAELAGLNESTTVYDPACGLGTLLIQCSRAGGISDYKLYGQEIHSQYVQLCRFNMLFNGLIRAEIETANSLQNSKFVSGKKLLTFDRVISHPPYQIETLLPSQPELIFEKDKETRHLFIVEEPAVAYKNNREASAPAQVEADFVTHILQSLQPDGKAILIVPHGALFKLGNAHTVRRYLIHKNYIEAVIDMPPNIFYSSKTNVSILILNKKKLHTDILFVDASTGFEPDRRRNKLRAEHTTYIREVFEAYKSVKNFAHRASFQEVTDNSNNYNLTAKRYIQHSHVPSEKDIEPLKKKVDSLTAELKKVRGAIDEELKYFM